MSRSDPARARTAGALLAIALGLASAGCGSRVGPIDVGALEARYPNVAAQRGHRLTELGPHFWIAGAELLEFVCLWPADRAIDVEIAGVASLAERGLVERALEVLGPVIGREFALGHARGRDVPEASSRGIRLEFIDGPDPGDPARMSIAAGDAIADCRVELEPGAPFAEAVLPAQLERASVRIRRARADALGRVRPLDDVELLGALLHELGHAIGYATHTSGGDTVMRLAPSEVRRMARGVAAGRPLRDATLSALYQLVSGAVTARGSAPAEAVITLRVFSMLARQEEWGRPRTRSGASTAEVWWPRQGGGRIALLARRPAQGAAWPPTFWLRANSAGREALRGSEASR